MVYDGMSLLVAGVTLVSGSPMDVILGQRKQDVRRSSLHG